MKAAAIVLTSAFYVVSFFATRGLLGWSSTDPLPPKFKLLGARIVEPHSLEGDPGAIHLWVEALDDDNFPSGVPRAYRLPYDAHLAEKTEAAIRASADGKPQGGRTADFGNGQGGRVGGDGARGHAIDDHHDRRRRSLFRRSDRPPVCATERTRRSILRRSPRHACLPRTRNSQRLPGHPSHEAELWPPASRKP